jgi:hypothetical protein
MERRAKTVEYYFDFKGLPKADKIQKVFSCPYCREKNNGFLQQYPAKHNEMLGINSNEEEYKHHIVQCPNHNCTERATLALLGSHVQICQERKALMVTCKHCGEEHDYSNIDKHVENDCSSLPCETCDQKVHASNYASHLETHNQEIQHILQMQTNLANLLTTKSLRGRSLWFFRSLNTHLSTSIARQTSNVDFENVFY